VSCDSDKFSLAVHEHGSTGQCYKNHEISPHAHPAGATSICDPSGPVIIVAHPRKFLCRKQTCDGQRVNETREGIGGAELRVGLRKSESVLNDFYSKKYLREARKSTKNVREWPSSACATAGVCRVLGLGPTSPTKQTSQPR
jgi:hypothetical protein